MNYIFTLITIALIVGSVLWYGNKTSQTAETTTQVSEEKTFLETETRAVDEAKQIVESISRTSTLNLSNRGLTSVPKDTFSRTDVEVLDLSHNALTGALPAEIRHMKNIKTLDLSDNDFTGVPAEIGQLEKLETLDLSNNRITGLPYELGNLKNLKILNLSGNEYSEYDLTIIKKSLPNSVTVITK